MAVGVGSAAFVSLLTMSSPQSMWFMVNQFQLLVLLPLTGAFIPQDLVDFFSGMSFVNFNFDFIPVVEVPPFSYLKERLGFDHSDSYLKDLGVNSGSTLVNTLSLIFMLFVYTIFHLLTLIYYTWAKKRPEQSKSRKVAIKLLEAFTLAIYIRTLIQSFQVTVLSCFREIKDFNTSKVYLIVSL